MRRRAAEPGRPPGRLSLASTGKSRAGALAAALALSLAATGMLVWAEGRLGVAGDALAYSALGLAIYLSLTGLAPRRPRKGFARPEGTSRR